MSDDISAEVIKKTQDYLGKYIKRPPLTEKLLKKPPFRFLHDIITNIIKETGFLKGLYNNNEMLSENIKDRDTKIAFLQKLIDVLKALVEEKITARPSKIIAGLEPAKTNELLQTIGRALDLKLDSTQAVEQVTGVPLSDRKPTTKSKDDKHKSKKGDEPKKLVRKNTEEKISVTKKKQSPRIEKDNKRNTSKEKPQRKQESVEKEVPSEKKPKEVVNEKLIPQASTSIDLSAEVEKSVLSTDVVKAVEEVFPPIQEETVKTNNVDLIKNEEKSLDVKVDKSESNEIVKAKVEEKKRPESPKQEPIELQMSGSAVPQRRPNSRLLRPPSVRPTSARPAAPRLRDKTSDTIVPPEQLVPLGKVHVIVEHATVEEDNEETVKVELPTEDEIQVTPAGADLPAEKGHLVRQILEQMPQETKIVAAPRLVQESGVDDRRLTKSIQTLTRSANPLGKLVSYMHEDVDSMLAELRSWTDVNKKLREQVTDVRRRNQEITKPLVQQLEKLEADIVRQRAMIHTTQAAVLRNQHKIKQLLTRE